MIFFFQAEDGIRDLVRSRGLGDVYKRQLPANYTKPWKRPAKAFTRKREAAFFPLVFPFLQKKKYAASWGS